MDVYVRIVFLLVSTLGICSASSSEGIHGYSLFPSEPVPGRTGFGTYDPDAVLAQWGPLWDEVKHVDLGDSEHPARKKAFSYLDSLQIGSRYKLYQAADRAHDEAQKNAIIKSLRSESFFWGHPEFLCYPGSVEHVRHAEQRYIPGYPQYNQKTLAKNILLKDHNQTKGSCIGFSEPVYWHCQWGDLIPVNKQRGPFRTYPWTPGASVNLDIGPLEPQLTYALRVIAATAALDTKKQFVFKLKINDGPSDAISTYVLRGRATDNFYETVVFMFHCVDARPFRAKLTLLKESQATLYTYNIDIHDVFGECAKKAGKTQATLSPSGPTPEPIADAAARAARDADLWQALPPMNSHMDNRQASKFSGGYEIPRRGRTWNKPYRIQKGDDKSPEAVYTRQDMLDHKVLPGSGGDRGWGLADGDAYRSFIAFSHQRRYMELGNCLKRLTKEYVQGNQQAGRDAAFLLCALAYQYPAVKPNNSLIFTSGGNPYQPTRRYGAGSDIPGAWETWTPLDLAHYYDCLFNYIDSNEELAAAVGNYIPWIKTSRDLHWFLNVYAIQYAANEVLHFRYYYDHGLPGLVMDLAVIQGDNDISQPWMEFIWTRGWEYPQTLAGLPDNVVTNTTRQGVSNIGSFYYTQAVGYHAAQLTEAYIRNGGLKKYDLSDFRQYPKSLAGKGFKAIANPAGGHNLGIGDVGGPSARLGRFGPVNKDLHLKSRIFSDWATILESGSQYRDIRFRRAAAITTCLGSGHAHHDTLDLRIYAHGSTLSGDFNQRLSYGRPRHSSSYVHNLLEVDGNGKVWTQNTGEWDGYAWARTLFDAPGAPYTLVEATPPSNHPNVTLMQRQVAILDVDEGSAAQGDTDPRDAEVVTPSSYFLDVIRVAGGKRHTYCFHGCTDEGFDVSVKNKVYLKEEGTSADERYMQRFRYERYFREEIPKVKNESWAAQQAFEPDRDRQWAADPEGDVLTATWKLDRLCETRMHNDTMAVTEPAKYIKLHLFDQTNARILHGVAVDTRDAAASCLTRRGTSGRCLYSQQNFSKDTEAVYVALIEPYAGEPFITERNRLSIPGNETDARQATAIRVKTKFNTEDICFTDGRPDTARSLPGGITVSGEFAYLSRDEHGLRQVTLAGGSSLEAPGISIKPVARAYCGTVTELDLLERTALVEGLPALKELETMCFEIGNDKHRSVYQVDSIKQVGDKAELHCANGLEIMRARVLEVDYPRARIRTNIAMLNYPGRNSGLIATGEDLSQRWRVTLEGGNRHEGFWFSLQGNPITAKDFPVTGRFSVWEFGVGDEVSLKTGVSFKRSNTAQWTVYATCAFRVAMGDTRLEWAPDGKAWKEVTGLLGPGAGTPLHFKLRMKKPSH